MRHERQHGRHEPDRHTGRVERAAFGVQAQASRPLQGLQGWRSDVVVAGTPIKIYRPFYLYPIVLSHARI